MGIPYFSRKTGKIEQEKVLGEWFVRLAYRPESLWFTDHILTKPFLSQVSGWLQNQKFSRSKINDFVKNYDIDMSEFVEKDFASFNDFFIRQFKPGKRIFNPNKNIFSAFAEARYLVQTDITLHQSFNVKNAEINLVQLLNDSDLANKFEGGTLLIARLCPVDYHRFHFPTDGIIKSAYKIPGAYHSVNPVAIQARPKLFLENEREVTIIENEIFGEYALIDVGAFGVGKIIQSYQNASAVHKGDEKGYFLFGGSTVIAVLQKDKFTADTDLIQNSQQGTETWVALGDQLGVSNHAN